MCSQMVADVVADVLIMAAEGSGLGARHPGHGSRYKARPKASMHTDMQVTAYSYTRKACTQGCIQLFVANFQRGKADLTL